MLRHFNFSVRFRCVCEMAFIGIGHILIGPHISFLNLERKIVKIFSILTVLTFVLGAQKHLIGTVL